MKEPPFFVVLLGTDYAGKSSALAALADGPWEIVSVDDDFLGPEYELIARLRRALVNEAVPGRYSADFAASLMQAAVVHLRDRILAAPRGRPLLVDSYYYKMLAKCQLMGCAGNPMLGWWRSFPQPDRVLYLEVSPETAWRRCTGSANRFEHYGERLDWPGFEAFQRDLGKLLLDEVRELPVTVIPERDGIGRMVGAIRKVLTRE